METSQHKKIGAILGILMALVLIPMAGALIYYKGTLPEDFFTFPSTSFSPKPGFNLTIFIIISITCFISILMYLFPRLFGFKRVEIQPEKIAQPKSSVKPPIWFWVGMVLFIGTLIVLWGKFTGPKIILNWAVIPLFWGFTMILDGIVYLRTKGHSIINDKPQTILGIGVCSVGAWLIFEYLNFFIGDNWIYPKAELISSTEFFLYALIGSAGLMPMTFEWYSLFTTFKRFRVRYSNGPSIVFSKPLKIILLTLVFISLALLSFFPDQLFFQIWLGPLFVLALLLSLINIWTPFTPIKDGNWSPLALMALAQLIQGTLCEFWNYFSVYHSGPMAGVTYNPDYWQYSLPYVNIIHVFEMPVLGLFGYFPFGVFCWISWIVFTYLLNIPNSIELDVDEQQ